MHQLQFTPTNEVWWVGTWQPRASADKAPDCSGNRAASTLLLVGAG